MQEPIYTQCQDRVGYHQGTTAGIMRTTPKGRALRPLFRCEFPTNRKAKNAVEKFVTHGDYSLFIKAVKH